MKKLPILLALLFLSSVVFAQFGEPNQGFGPRGPGDFPGDPGFGEGSPQGFPNSQGQFGGFDQSLGFEFGESFDPQAADIGGGGANLFSLKIYNRLIKAVYKAQNKFKESCLQDGGEEVLVSEIKSIYESNQSEITDICRKYEE